MSNRHRIPAPSCARAPGRFLLPGLLLVLALAVGFPASARADGHDKNVLVLLSYDLGDAWSESVFKGIRQSLASVPDTKLHVEFLDARRHRGERYLKTFRTFLENKYENIPLALAVVADNAAFSFFLDIRPSFRPNLPVVFCGVNDFDPEVIAHERNVTGVNEALDIAATVNLALRLFPDSGTVAVIGGSKGIGKVNLDAFRKHEPDFARRVEVRELVDVPEENAAGILGDLPPGAPVFRMDNLRGPDGSSTPLLRSIRTISTHAKGPVFTLWDFDMGRGAFGGIVASGLEQGREGGRLAREYLETGEIETIPVVMESPNVPMFDHKQMERFSPNFKTLPPNARILHRPESFYETHRAVIWTAVGIMLFMFICIMVLLAALLARRRAETALRASEKRYRLYVDNAPSGIFIADGKGNYVDVNPEACRITGYSREELLSMAIPDLLCPDSLADGMRHFETVARTGKDLGVLEFIRKDGERGWWEIAAIKLSATRLLGFVNDVTRRVAMEREVIAAKEAAESANKAKSEFLANMSHEIRTPLNGVMGMLQILGRTVDDPEQRSMLENAVDSSRRLTRLLGDILDLSRVEAGKLPLNSEAFSLAEIFDSVRVMFKEPARAKGLSLELSPQDSIPDPLIGDPVRITQILVNLLGNAVKYTDKGGVRATASLLPLSPPGKANILFSVTDTGIGIPDALLEGVTRAFTQAEQSAARRYEGAGLGLSIVERLVALMGGHMSIDSTLGRGTEAHIVLPLSRGGEARPRVPEQRIDPLSPARRILLAEDDNVNRLGLKSLLEMEGCEVVCAENGQKALDILAREDFDIVLMDIRMPVMDGLAAIKAIRNAPELASKSRIPVIALTALATVDDQNMARDAGADAFVAKPVEIDELLAAMHQLPARGT